MTRDPDAGPTGRELYADYSALWHLESIRVLETLREMAGKPPPARPARVAIIDTSVARDHPCLTEAIDADLALDLFSTRLGAFTYADPAREEERLRVRALPNLGTDIAAGLPVTEALLAEFVDRLSPGQPVHPGGIGPAAAPDFSAHGTAVAGLVGARPAVMALAPPGAPAGTPPAELPLPYCGVDPFCRIVPVSTNFDPDPEALILAFLYAEVIDAQVVLVPRSLPDPFRTPPELARVAAGPGTLLEAVHPCEIGPREAELWEELARLIVRVSQRRVVVCAAGNDQEAGAIYPANLAAEDNGVVAVGAANAKGLVSGYSDPTSATILGPSDDGEVFDRRTVRLDIQAAGYDAQGVPAQNRNADFSHFEIVTTDVPGLHGYAFSPFASEEPEDGLREFGSYFCRFGGTSAASAIVAGLLSLGHSLGRIAPDADGPGAKGWLLAHAVTVSGDGRAPFHFPSWDGVHVTFPGLGL